DSRKPLAISRSRHSLTGGLAACLWRGATDSLQLRAVAKLIMRGRYSPAFCRGAWIAGLLQPIHASAVAVSIVAQGLTRFGPLTMNPRFSRARLHTSTCRCCWHCGPGNGRAICYGFLGRLTMVQTFGCDNRRRALAW